jgi:uncharacterized membrane protein YeaQ/YmgE (transglycosylase-associated protein family)
MDDSSDANKVKLRITRMPRVIQREIRKRGFFGWIFLILFWIFNAFMAAWLFAYWALLNRPEHLNDIQRAGAVIGGTIGTGVLLLLLGCGRCNPWSFCITHARSDYNNY